MGASPHAWSHLEPRAILLERSLLFGAAEALREAGGLSPIPPAEQADHAPCLAAARVVLGESEFAAAWAAGRTLSLEQACDLALAEG